MAKASLILTLVAAGLMSQPASHPAHGGVTDEEVEQAIRDGARYLRGQQKPDGSWEDVVRNQPRGTTALATLALLSAGEPADGPSVGRALAHLERFDVGDPGKTYTVALQAMVLARADPERHRERLLRCVRWLERAQIRPRDRVLWPGSWTYDNQKPSQGDNSNTQYALLALYEAGEVGIPVDPEVWKLARRYWEVAQQRGGPDLGAWDYSFRQSREGTAGMTCAGISALLMCSHRLGGGSESFDGDRFWKCGDTPDRPLLAGFAWLSDRFRVDQNSGRGSTWKYYYLRDLEVAGRLSGLRHFGTHDWYAEGAEELVRLQDKLLGSWPRNAGEDSPLLTTSFALLFLAEGRSPVLIQKARHGPAGDWNEDPNDIRNLVGLISRDWGRRITWQYVDPDEATLDDLRRAPILYVNGHEAPEFDDGARERLREYCDAGGMILAEACCSKPAFDEGFRALIEEMFPEPESDLHLLPPEHLLWGARHRLDPGDHPLWGIETGGRTPVIYSPSDLSCSWNQLRNHPDDPMVVRAGQVGQNIVEYVTGRDLPGKLTPRQELDPNEAVRE